MKMQSRKLISLILAVVLVLGVFPMAGFATGEEGPVNEPPAITQTPEGQTGDDTATPTPIGQDETATPTPVVTDEAASPTPVTTPALPEETATPTPTPTPKAVVLADLRGEELYAYLLTLNEDELTAAPEELTQEQIDSLSGLMSDEQALEWFGIGPFAPLALGAGFVPFEAMGIQSLDNEDLVTTKDATYNSASDTVSIELTAYAKGVLHQVGKPADIVLVLDESLSMDGSYGTETRYTPVFAQISSSGSRWISYGGVATQLSYRTVSGVAGWYRGSSPNYVRVFPAFQDQTNLPAETYQFYSNSNLNSGQRVYPTFNTGTTYYIFKDGEYRQLSYSSSNGWRYDGTRYFPILDGQNQNTTSVQFYTRSDVPITRSDALKSAVGQFVGNLRTHALTNNLDHKIAIIGFERVANYYTGSGFLDVSDDDAYEDIEDAIDNLSADVPATRTDEGMEAADGMFTGEAPSDRNRIVILFTDGYPQPHSNDDDITSATIIRDTLAAAFNMKNNEGVTIFTIGINSGLNPSTPPVEYGSNENTFLHAVSSNYPVSTWGSRTTTTYTRRTNSSSPSSGTYYIFQNYNGTAIDPPTGTAVQLTLNPSGQSSGWYYGSTGNWTRVNYVSNVNNQNTSLNNYHFWSVTGTTTQTGIIPGDRNDAENAEGGRMEFYYTPDNAEELSDVFLTVQESLSGGLENITIKDFLMPQFEMGTSAITSISARIGSTVIDPSLISYNSASRLLSVGPVRLPAVIMDGDTPAAGELAAKQLVITFTADVKDDFIGGNDVLTNDTGSGVYGSDDNPIEHFERPEVNVPLEYDLFSLTDQHVYLGDGALISDFFVTNNYAIDSNPYQYDGNNNGYVNIVYTVKDEDGDTIGTFTVNAGHLSGSFLPDHSDELTNLTEDTWYTITATITPSETGDPANGELAVPITSEDGDETANIYVYKPVVTTQDVAVYLTKNPTDAELTANAIASVVWKHNDDVAVPANMTEPTTPGLDYSFDLPAAGYPTADTTVNITGIATVRGSSTTATLAGTDLNGRVSPFTVYVMKPVVTCADSEMFLGDSDITWSTYFGDFDKSWTEQPANTALIGTQLSFGLNIDLTALHPAGATSTGFTATAEGENNFNISVWVGTENVTDYSTINNPVVGQTGHHFTVLVVTGQLTINKSVEGALNDECFLFTISVDRDNDGHADYTFKEVIEGSGSKVITGLPKGTYTVTEDTDWSWRYNSTDVDQTGGKVLGKVGTTYITAIMASVSNSDRTPFWLSGESLAVNKFAPYAG